MTPDSCQCGCKRDLIWLETPRCVGFPLLMSTTEFSHQPARRMMVMTRLTILIGGARAKGKTNIAIFMLKNSFSQEVKANQMSSNNILMESQPCNKLEITRLYCYFCGRTNIGKAEQQLAGDLENSRCGCDSFIGGWGGGRVRTDLR